MSPEYSPAAYRQVFAAVHLLLAGGRPGDSAPLQARHPDLFARVKAGLERLLARDRVFVARVSEGWYRLTRGDPGPWRAVYRGRPTGPQAELVRTYFREQTGLMAEALDPPARLSFWLEQERAAGLDRDELCRRVDTMWGGRPSG